MVSKGGGVLTLVSGSGSDGYSLQGLFYSQDLAHEDVLFFNAAQLLVARGHPEAAAMLATLGFHIHHGDNDFGDEFCILHARLSINQYEYVHSKQEELAAVFMAMRDVLNEIGPYIRFVSVALDQALPPENWKAQLANSLAQLRSNQALFSYPDSPKQIFQGLYFRSKAEIGLFKALVAKGLLVLPLPVAVMGKERLYREPDFVVFHNGKCGILELHGDKWHPPETASKEAERRRWFSTLGVKAYEVFPADLATSDPEKLIRDFLAALERA
jgi:hypothetical protein